MHSRGKMEFTHSHIHSLSQVQSGKRIGSQEEKGTFAQGCWWRNEEANLVKELLAAANREKQTCAFTHPFLPFRFSDAARRSIWWKFLGVAYPIWIWRKTWDSRSSKKNMRNMLPSLSHPKIEAPAPGPISFCTSLTLTTVTVNRYFCGCFGESHHELECSASVGQGVPENEKHVDTVIIYWRKYFLQTVTVTK